MENSEEEIIETYGNRTYFLNLKEKILYWKKNEKRIELNLNNEIIKDYIQDFEREELTAEKILKTLIWDLNPSKESIYEKMKNDNDSQEEKLLKALQAADKNPCPLETQEGYCFADANNCNTYRVCGFFGVYACKEYENNLELEKVLFDKV